MHVLNKFLQADQTYALHHEHSARVHHVCQTLISHI